MTLIIATKAGSHPEIVPKDAYNCPSRRTFLASNEERALEKIDRPKTVEEARPEVAFCTIKSIVFRKPPNT
jgi:hypothetical protein